MKKFLLIACCLTGICFAESAKTSTLVHRAGNTNYYGTARTTVGTVPDTNALTWTVVQVVSTTNGLESVKNGYGLVAGVAKYDVIRWIDVVTTNVVYK